MNKKIATPFIGLFLLTMMLWAPSCKKADIKFGQDFLDNDITQIFKVDSFGVDVSTVFLDSFITSGKGTVLLGGYKDPLFGTVTTSSYFDLVPPAYADVYAGTTLDSICLILNPNKSFYGDTTSLVNIIVEELKDSISLPENYYYYYNNASFAVKPTSAINTSTDITVRPRTDSKISIKLPNAFGNTLLNKLKTPTDIDLKTSAAFLSYFKGIKLSTNSSISNMIIGCSDAVTMRMYYQVNLNSPVPTHQSVDFTLTNKSHQFNNISINRTTGTAAIQLLGTGKRVIPSTASNNTSYTQAATGSMIKFTFPTIRSIPMLPNYAKLLKATLIVKPLQGSYSSSFHLPLALRLSTTDANNMLGYDLSGIGGNGSYAPQYGSLQVDGALGLNTQYQYDLTQFIHGILENQFITPGEGLLLTPPSPNFENDFARVAIGNKFNNAGKIQLLIYYAAVK